jgi:ketosteroid isomerase-like protein
MTSKFAAALSAALVLSIGAARAADVPPDVTKTITADYALGCAAALDPSDANLTAAFAFYSPDFVDLDVKGKKFTRDQVVANGKHQMKQLHTTACEPSIVSETLNADGTVTVVAAVHVAGSIQAPDGNHDLDVSAKAQDTWTQTAGTWQLTQTQDLHTLVKMDGNVVQDEGQ